MLAKLVKRWRLSSAARRYARELPAQVLKDYGAATVYSRPQIEGSVGRAGLPVAYIFFGFALLMEKILFDDVYAGMPPHAYEELRRLLTKYSRRSPNAGFELAPENLDVTFIGRDGSM
jgi:hypothetical protein